ncbi:hypothetical protein HMPREF1983_01170 [Gemella bergeri ATCC 700627]|uniref:TIGR02185 family protein n=2 Tax=Gemella bergeri TaxID=84136 RepID=U2RUE7_9BACL|nr:hypothetical protein HMPREF1983_01170 [Gemella bergeri ATCC 700627]
MKIKMKLKTKDYIFLGMTTVLSIVVYVIAMMISSMFGAFGHSVSPGVWGLLAGTIFVYLCYNYNKFGIFTIFIIIHMIIFSLMGGAYIPWLISSISAAFLADIILKVMGHANVIAQCLALSLINIGFACGAWIPIIFFADSYKSDWVKRGQTAEAMDASIKYGSGHWMIIGAVVIIALSSLGVLIGRKILKKYQKNQK